MKILFVATLMLLLSTALWAQGDQTESVNFCKKVTDATCNSVVVCQTAENCEYVDFTVPWTGTYYFKCLTKCSSSDCKYCYGRVCLRNQDQGWDINSCHAAGGDCTQNCTPAVIQQYLETNTNYRLVVCLTTCEGHTCQDCGEGCRAVGYVYWDGSPCPAP